MIRPSTDTEPVVRNDVITREPLPGSRKIYVPGNMHRDLRVPMREVAQAPTASRVPGGADEPNSTVAIYDTSGPYSDPTIGIVAAPGGNGTDQRATAEAIQVWCSRSLRSARERSARAD